MICSRRDFIIGALATSTVLLANELEAAMLMFDPTRPDACQFASRCAQQGWAVWPIKGDTFRLTRQLLGQQSAPQTLAGLTTHADFILISGTAAEYGYRLQSNALSPWVLKRRPR